MALANQLKILFNPDRYLKPAELIELQEFIYDNHQAVFDALLDKFLVLKGCGFEFLSSNAVDVEFRLSPGLIYIRGKFVQVAGQTFTCPRDATYLVRASLNLAIASDETIFKDPYLPQTSIFGKPGANRETYEVTLNVVEEGTLAVGYPIYRLDFQNPNPLLGLVTPIQNKLAGCNPLLIRETLAAYFQTERLNYVARDLSLRLIQQRLVVSPGIGFVQGKKVELCYPAVIDLAQETFIPDKKYFIKLTKAGDVLFSARIYADELNLGTVIEDSTGDLQLYPTKERVSFVEEIVSLQKLITYQQQELARYQLLANVDAANDQLITETFIDETNSDINNYFYTAFVDTVAEKLTLGVTGRQLNSNDIALFAELQATSLLNNRYLMLQGTEMLNTIQSRFTGWQELVPIRDQPQIRITPNLGLRGLEPSNFGEQQFELWGSGYLESASNLELKINDQYIIDVEMILGTNTGGLVQANQDGRVHLKFTLPETAYNKSVISLENEVQSARVSLNVVGATITNDNLIIGEVASTFTTNQQMIAVGAGVLLRRTNTIEFADLNQVIGQVTLVEEGVDLNLAPVIATAELTYGDIKSTEALARVYFEKPVYLCPNKSYAVVVSSSVSGLELGYATNDQAALNLIQQINQQKFVDGNLYRYENQQWQAYPNQDLAFGIIQYLPQANQGTLRINLNELEGFNQLRINSADQAVQYQIQHPLNTLPQEIPNGSGSLTFATTNTLEVILTVKSQGNSYPIVDLAQVSIDPLISARESNWLSRNYSLGRVYDEAQITLEQIQPEFSEINVYLSSNQGQVWRQLELAEATLLDNNIGLYAQTYIIKDLSPTVELFNLDNSSVTKPRKEAKLRIELKTSDLSYLPEVRGLVAHF